MLQRHASVKAPSPLEMFSHLQQGVTPPVALQRAFLMEHFREDLSKNGIHDAKLGAMDLRTCSRYLRRAVFDRYLQVPLRLFTFDMEFTNIPTFTAEGPTADITEIGVYSPFRDARLSVLVHSPGDREMPDAVVQLTGITNETLKKEGVPFPEAWKMVWDFLGAPEPDEIPGSQSRLLLLSHGGKLADVSMLQWAWKKHNIAPPKELVFGDTYNLIRDAHRRRPVTPDKHPPSWRLADLVAWLRVDSGESAHRAGDDAKLTWDALYHTLDRYGEETLTPRQQLVLRFFDTVAKEQLHFTTKHGDDASTLGSFDLDSLFTSVRAGSSSVSGSTPLATEVSEAKGATAERRSPAASANRRGRRRVAEGETTAAKPSASSRAATASRKKGMFAEVGLKQGLKQTVMFVPPSDVTTGVPDL